MKEKNYEFAIESFLYERIKEPIRSIIDVIKIVIDVLSYILWKPINKHKLSELKIVISKMYRIFFVYDEKSFSIAMPFYVKMNQDGTLNIYDNNVLLDSKILSYVKNIFNNIDFNDIETIDLDLSLQDENLTELEKKDVKYVFYKLITTEYGYIRYEDDPIRENGRKHPRYHVDINYSNAVTFKLELKSKKEYVWLKDLLDLNTKCKQIID